VSQRVHYETVDDSDSVKRRGHQEVSVVNQCISSSDISPSSSDEKYSKSECVFPVDKEAESQLLVTFRFDNTPGACSSTDPLIRTSSLSDAEDRQVYQFSNDPDPSQVSNGFDAECGQADRRCTKLNEKNSKVENYETCETDFVSTSASSSTNNGSIKKISRIRGHPTWQ